MVTKRRCVWNKIFPLGDFMLHFTTCIMFLYIREMTKKASNVSFKTNFSLLSVNYNCFKSGCCSPSLIPKEVKI